MEENGHAPSLKKELKSPPIQKVLKKFEMFPAPSYKMRKKVLAATKNILKNIPWKIRKNKDTNTMQNKDTNTDYQKVVRVGDQIRNYNQNHFFFRLFEICIHYFLYREFLSPT